MKLFPTPMKNVLAFLSVIVFGCSSVTEPANNESLPSPATVEGPKNGTLLIIGGASQSIFYVKFMELIGGPDSPIIVIPTAASSDTLTEEFLENYKQGFVNRGFNNVTVLHTRDPLESNSDEFIEPIKTARGVWFSGGRQWRHADSYLNTKAHEEFRAVLDRGGVIAGSSAGATIQGSYLARGDTKANTIMMGDHEEGLGFISNVAIDQHLFARNRQFDLFEILENRPELLGIGLDENTGIIVQGNKFQVYGESYVAIYDGTRWSAERDTIYQLPQGSHDFYMLRQGHEYNLTKRMVIRYGDRTFYNPSSDKLKKYIGTFENPENSRRLGLFVQEDTLRLFQEWNENQYTLICESPQRFFRMDSEQYYEFTIDDYNRVMDLFMPYQDSQWKKIAN